MIKIKQNSNGDTRTAVGAVTFEKFQVANDNHIEDVTRVMEWLGNVITVTGKFHDNTKKLYEKEFYDDFMDARHNNTGFMNMDWYKKHIKEERHHLNSNCPDNVTLIDVLEMIADGVCAGKARSGFVSEIKLSSEILQKALKNTQEMIENIVEIEE